MQPYDYIRAPDNVFLMSFNVLHLWLCVQTIGYILFFTKSMFGRLLESSRWDDSSRWLDMGFGKEMDTIEIKILLLSGPLLY